jgi:hypothetical protein
MCFFSGGGLYIRERIEFFMERRIITFLRYVGSMSCVNTYKIECKRSEQILEVFKLSSLPRYNLTFLKITEE